MSLNIQTANGLLEIGGKVTKEKVISALGYSPADENDLPNIVEDESGALNIIDESGNVILKVDADGVHTTEVTAKGVALGETVLEHIDDSSVHVTPEEKEIWNNKSDFSGVYDDLINAPNIKDDDAGNMVVADEKGNIIMQVDADGITTTNVNAKTIELNGEDLDTRLNSIESVSLPNIIDNETGELVVSDKSGNAIMKVDANGLTTTGVNANTLVLAGEDIGIKIDRHISDKNTHVTLSEKAAWNNKSNFDGSYNSLTDKPNILDDGSDEFKIVDEKGNAIFKVSDDGVDTTNVNTQTIKLDGEDLGARLDAIEAISLPNIIDNESGNLQIADPSGNVIVKIDESGLTTTTVKADAVVLDGKDVAVVLNELAENVGDGLEAHNVDENAHANLFKDVITTSGGGIINMASIFGEGPYTIEFTEEVGYDGSGVGGGSNGSSNTPLSAVLYSAQSLTNSQKEQARTNIGAQSQITGAVGDFVVIGSDGKVTTKTIPYAEEANFGG